VRRRRLGAERVAVGGATIAALAIVATCLGCGRLRDAGNDARDAREAGDVTPDGGDVVSDGGADGARDARRANDGNDGSPDGDASRANDANDANDGSLDGADAEPVADGGGDSNGPAAPALTEWQLPFENSLPEQITAAPGAVYYVDFTLFSLGRLDLGSGNVTQWFPSFTPSVPGDIKFRTSDATLFVTSAPPDNLGEIGQFDPTTRVYRHWRMPSGLSGAPPNLALDAVGRVVFANATDTGSYVIGRLDAATNTFVTWPIPDAVVSSESSADRVTIAPDGTVFFNVGGFGNQCVARLDLSTGVFTAWSFPSEVSWAIAADASGDVFFQWQTPDFGIARLAPGDGRLTEWTAPHGQNDDFVLADGLLFFGTGYPLGDAAPAASALDPSQPGIDSALTPLAVGPVTPSSAEVAPLVDQDVTFEAGDAQVTSDSVTGTANGAFTEWSVPGAPRFFSTGPGPAVYFSENSTPAIGRLLP
jgi:hypothetical protein